MRKPFSITISGLSLLPKSAQKPKHVEEACCLSLKTKPAPGGSKPKGEVNIVFLPSRKMRALNKSFLKKDRDTDVLAFNYAAPLPGKSLLDQAFGDVFISSAKVRSQAADLGHSPLKEALTLVSHGSLHLLGYDDSTPRQKAAMTKLQDKVLSRLNR